MFLAKIRFPDQRSCVFQRHVLLDRSIAFSLLTIKRPITVISAL